MTDAFGYDSGIRPHNIAHFYAGFDGVSREAIFSMDLNGKRRALVSDCQGHGVADPEVSPDGTMLSV